jgi:GT2 family glycosyltransferase
MTVFVVLHYKVYEETKACVTSLLKLNGDKRIIVVDNGSMNDSGKRLADTFREESQVQVLINKDNAGFARGNNLGYCYAKEKYNPEFIVVMNNDMEIRNTEFIAGIEKCYREYAFHIMAPDVYSTKAKKHQNPDKIGEYDIQTLKKIKKEIEWKLRVRFLIKLKHLLKPESPGRNIKPELFDRTVRINVPLHGSFYVFDKRFINLHEECFYSKTFMYMESQILYHQARREQMKMVYDPRLQVLHHEDVATDSSYSDQYKKAIFTNKCLLSSCKAYLELLEQEGIYGEKERKNG